MVAFYKRNTLIKSICFMALMAAINVIVALMTNFLPLLGVLLVIFLPLTSALVEVTCKDRYFPIYAFATIGLSIVVSLSSIDVTLFYVLPSIVTGFIFGLMSKHNLPNFLSIFISSIAQTILSFAFIPIIEVITDHNLLNDIITIFNINDIQFFNMIIILIFFLMGLIQTVLSFIVVNNELLRMGLKKDNEKDFTFLVDSLCLISCLLITIFNFIYIPISYVCLGFAWYFAVFSAIFSIKKHQKLLPSLMLASLFVNLILFAALNSFMPKASEFLLLGIAPILISGLSITFYFLKKQKS